MTKCCSSSNGAVDGPGGDGEDVLVLVRGGEHGVLVLGDGQGVLLSVGGQ